VSRRRVRFTATARGHVKLLDQWWRANSVRPQILHEDLQAALELLATLPSIGSVYQASPVPDTRRFYLERLLCHLYYTFDEHDLVIRAVWHVRRGFGPEFGSFQT
jgi:plasmid stabilization system protein ParE